MDCRKYLRNTLILLLAVLALIAAYVAVVDPYFHYHKALGILEYPLDNERYQNDGIARNFDYDAIITGTSMAENFRTSELDELFGVNSVKLCFSGASFKETGDRLRRALKNHPDTKMVVRCLDYYKFAEDKDHMEYDSYPDYLYDDSIFNDVRYLFDKNTLTKCREVIEYTLDGNTTTSFDDYSSWRDKYEYGEAAVKAHYDREKTCADEQKPFTDGFKAANDATIDQNVISLIKDYPDTQFYIYLPPYGLAAWDGMYRIGNLGIVMDEQEYIISKLLQYDNVHVFAFLDCYDIICDLDNYMDTSHYGPWVNSMILESMSTGEHEITEENLHDYCAEVKEFYLNYDYDAVFGD